VIIRTKSKQVFSQFPVEIDPDSEENFPGSGDECYGAAILVPINILACSRAQRVIKLGEFAGDRHKAVEFAGIPQVLRIELVEYKLMRQAIFSTMSKIIDHQSPNFYGVLNGLIDLGIPKAARG